MLASGWLDSIGLGRWAGTSTGQLAFGAKATLAAGWLDSIAAAPENSARLASKSSIYLLICAGICWLSSSLLRGTMIPAGFQLLPRDIRVTGYGCILDLHLLKHRPAGGPRALHGEPRRSPQSSHPGLYKALTYNPHRTRSNF